MLTNKLSDADVLRQHSEATLAEMTERAEQAESNVSSVSSKVWVIFAAGFVLALTCTNS